MFAEDGQSKSSAPPNGPTPHGQSSSSTLRSRYIDDVIAVDMEHYNDPMQSLDEQEMTHIVEGEAGVLDAAIDHEMCEGAFFARVKVMRVKSGSEGESSAKASTGRTVTIGEGTAVVTKEGSGDEGGTVKAPGGSRSSEDDRIKVINVKESGNDGMNVINVKESGNDGLNDGMEVIHVNSAGDDGIKAAARMSVSAGALNDKVKATAGRGESDRERAKLTVTKSARAMSQKEGVTTKISQATRSTSSVSLSENPSKGTRHVINSTAAKKVTDMSVGAPFPRAYHGPDLARTAEGSKTASQAEEESKAPGGTKGKTTQASASKNTAKNWIY